MDDDRDDSMDRVTTGLRAWARGLLPLEAAVELIAAADGGRLLFGPWIRLDACGQHWFDPGVAAVEEGVLSGGERRVLTIAMSLASAEHPLDLSDAVCGLDDDTLDAILRGLAHSGKRNIP